MSELDPNSEHSLGPILAIETSTEACSAALLCTEDDSPRLREAEVPRAHAELILPMVESLLAELGITLKELSAIAFARGPGSFTGVRLAASVTQGLAYGASLPVVPVSTLAAMAAAALTRASAAPHVLVCHDARMGEVYWAIFDRDLTLLGAGEQVSPPGAVQPSGAWQPPDAVQAPAVGSAHDRLTPDAAAHDLTAQRWALVGRGLAAYPEIVDRWRSDPTPLVLKPF
ncbi:MAG: tRNA (adenosine(37)-N6)-threonylcarbamoyltransferase complex dimerization subunit type 1 TsaB, partial [Candidatus Limnocylindrus sp.]